MTLISASRAQDAYYTTHARDVIRRRGIDPALIEEALVAPEVTRTSHGNVLYSRGDLTVVTDVRGDRVVIITALLRCEGIWTDEDAKSTFDKYGAAS